MNIMNPYPSWLVMMSETTVKTCGGNVTKGPQTGRRTTLLPYLANDVQMKTWWAQTQIPLVWKQKTALMVRLGKKIDNQNRIN